MRYSTSFLRTQKESPKDEVAVNARLLIRASFIHKLMAGVYSLLPLGMRVRERVISIIREEMNALGSAEMLMPALHPKSAWELTGRWKGLEQIMYQFKDQSGHEFGLGPTHEEIIALVARQVIVSYHDLPRSIYQIQTKFRNEQRAKSGLLRGREFTMKDLYSFHADESSLNLFYEESKKAYRSVFERCGLKTVITEASGGDFSKEYSHEFMVEAGAGEDEIMLCRLCGWAQNTEIAAAKIKDSCPSCRDGVIEKVRSIEVGNIFKLGTRFSEPLGFLYRDVSGVQHPVVMGSYGIGIERLIGTVVEMHHDDRGIIWPREIAPALAHIVLLGEDAVPFAESVYAAFTRAGLPVLFDDRQGVSAGEKLADADLIGLPWRLVVSDKTVVQDKVEVRERKGGESRLMKIKECVHLAEREFGH